MANDDVVVGLKDLVGLRPLPEGQDSVSYIRRLRDADDSLCAWVKTSERLPDDDSAVLAAIWWTVESNPSSSGYAVHDCDYYEGGVSSEQKIFADCEGEEFTPEEVEFWIYKKDLVAHLPGPKETEKLLTDK